MVRAIILMSEVTLTSLTKQVFRARHNTEPREVLAIYEKEKRQLLIEKEKNTWVKRMKPPNQLQMHLQVLEHLYASHTFSCHKILFI